MTFPKLIAIFILLLEFVLLNIHLSSLSDFNDQLPMILWLLMLAGFLHYTHYQKPIKYFTNIGIGLFLIIILGQIHYHLAGDNCTYDEFGKAYCTMPTLNLLLTFILTPITLFIFIISYQKFKLYQYQNTYKIAYTVIGTITIFHLINALLN